MLLTETVIMKWTNSNKKYYMNKGYVFTKNGDEFEVKTDDLIENSPKKVEVQCDGEYCNHRIISMTYQTYLKRKRDNNTTYCSVCSKKLFNYGDNIAKTRLKNSISLYNWCIKNNRQDVLDRWDYDKNYPFTPDSVCYSSNGINKKGFWLKCENNSNHKSEQQMISNILKRPNDNLNCKQCNSFENWCIEHEKQNILDRWDYDLNKCSPSEISHADKGYFWFKCPNGTHPSEYKQIYVFTLGYDSSLDCKACNSIAQWGIDNLGDDFLEKYWSNKNTLNPWVISKGCNSKKVWIKCQEKDYHEDYEITFDNFRKGRRCPYCINHKIHPKDSLGQYIIDNYGQDFLDKIWSNKNEKTPFEYAPTTNKKLWWKCPNEKHEDFKREAYSSMHGSFDCPDCVKHEKDSKLQKKVSKYIKKLGYTILNENNCSITPINPKTKYKLPFDNEIKELKLILEVHGEQHYKITGFHIHSAKHDNISPEQELHYQQLKDRYKRIIAIKQGYFYLEIPYWTDDKDKTWKQLIDDKINEIKYN